MLHQYERTRNKSPKKKTNSHGSVLMNCQMYISKRSRFVLCSNIYFHASKRREEILKFYFSLRFVNPKQKIDDVNAVEIKWEKLQIGKNSASKIFLVHSRRRNWPPLWPKSSQRIF